MKINLKSYTMEKARILKEGKEAVIIAVGNIFEEADKAEKILKEEGYVLV